MSNLGVNRTAAAVTNRAALDAAKRARFSRRVSMSNLGIVSLRLGNENAGAEILHPPKNRKKRVNDGFEPQRF
jgi:hypothetical protein